VKYTLREPNRGEVVAFHVRDDGPDGKRMGWELPDGTSGLNGIRTAALPLYGAAAAHRWDLELPVIVTEGEKAASALVKAGWQACGTVTGAGGCPNREPLMILAGCRVLLWPDADPVGEEHMLKLASVLGEPSDIAASIRWIAWPAAGVGGDAHDALATGVDVAALVAEAGPVPRPEVTEAALIDFAEAERRRRARTSRHRDTTRTTSSESPIERFNRSVSVSDVLRRDYGTEARAGHAVRCPFHDDQHPSLAIFADDRRAYCHAPSCWAYSAGRGRDAWDLAGQIRGLAL
jgi:DNA primase